MFSYSKFEHHYTKSVFNHKEPISEDFKVFVNGEEVPVYTCRISKYPFNRVWPGFQRPVNQTETASFVNLVSDEELKIEVVANCGYEKILIKPYSKGISHTEKDSKICFTLKENGQFVLQADNYHHTLYIFNSSPIECPDKEAVTHYFGPGVYMPGKIILHDNESVYVDKDALVFGCIYAENAKNIRIFGNGLLDDTGEGRIDENGYEAYTNGNVKFYDCENVNLEGVLLRNSAAWCVNFFHCFNCTADDIKVFGQWRYNTDGVDIVNCQNITVKNSFIHSFDDTVTIKGIDRYAGTDNINILTENCVLWCDWGRCCEVGIETECREYKNIVFKNCDILKGGTVALDIQNGDCAEISNVVFENINVEYNSFDTPEVYQQTDDMVYDAADKIHVPYILSIKNHRFRTQANLELWGIPLQTAELKLDGITQGLVRDVTVKNINVYYDEKIPKTDGKFNVPIRINSSIDDVEYNNIEIDGLFVNGVKITEENAVSDIKDVKSFNFI